MLEVAIDEDIKASSARGASAAAGSSQPAAARSDAGRARTATLLGEAALQCPRGTSDPAGVRSRAQAACIV